MICVKSEKMYIRKKTCNDILHILRITLEDMKIQIFVDLGHLLHSEREKAKLLQIDFYHLGLGGLY